MKPASHIQFTGADTSIKTKPSVVQRHRAFTVPGVLGSILLTTGTTQAATFYWDEDGAAPGFGTAGTGAPSTWAAPTPGGAYGWSTDATGASAIGPVTTAADNLYFGTDTVGLATGTITLSDPMSAANLYFGKASGDITLSGSTISIGGGTTVVQASSGGGSVSNTHTIDSDITKSGGTLQFGTQGTTNELYVVNGVISGGSGIDGRMVNSTGQLYLNGLNTFSGNISMTTGQYYANTLADGGLASSFGVGSGISMGGFGGQNPRLIYTGSAATSTDRSITIQSNAAAGIIAQNGAVDFSGTVKSSSSAGTWNLYLSGTADTGTNTISGGLQDNGSGKLRVQLQNLGASGVAGEAALWDFTGNNTYTGSTTIANGSTLKVSGSGNLGGGTYSSTLTIDDTSSFHWDGDNLQVFDGTVQGSGSGGILATGTGQLRFVFGNNILFSGPVTVDGGSIQFRNTADLKGFSPKNLNVEGGGTLAVQSSVGGNNRTVLNNKTWTFDNGGGTLTFNNGNHLFQGGGSTHNFDVTAAGSGSTIQSINGGFMNMQGSGVIELDVADGSEDRDLTLSTTFNNGLIAKDGAGTLAITGAYNGSYNIAINAGTLEVGGAATLAGGTFTAGIANDGIYNHNSTADQTISGVISGTGTLVKDNAGTLTLSAVNTYTGDTTVSAGILSLGDGTNNTGLADAADVSVAVGAVLDLNYVGTDTVDELTLGGAPAAAGTWGATGSGATNINDTFFTGAGTLTVTTGGGTPFSTWAAATGATNDPDANDDPDSFVNLLEFGFGTDPLVSDSTPLVADGSKNGAPIVQASGGGGGVTFEALFVRRDDYDTSGSATYTAQFSSDLVTFYDSSATPVFVADSTVDPDYEVVSVPYPATLPDGKKARFFRMKVDLVP